MDKLEELLGFLDELKSYREVLTKTDSKLPEYKLEYEKLLKDKSWADFLAKYPLLQKYASKISKEELREEVKEELREKLVRKSGALKGIIIELTGKSYVKGGLTGRFDMWSEAFNTTAFSSDEPALAFCIQNTNEAIGKLEADIERGIRDKETGLLVTPQTKMTTEAPKAFIAHEGMTRALQKVNDFLDALGIKHSIAEKEPSDGRQTEGQVTSTYGQADFVIILATKGKAINRKTGASYMGLNVADELGRAREAKKRVILLLQMGVEPHTNISGIIYERFIPQRMDDAFTKIIKELRNWGFIRVEK